MRTNRNKLLSLAGLDAPAAPGGAGIAGVAVLSVPAWAMEAESTVPAAGVTAGMRVVVSLAAHDEADENHESMLDVRAARAVSQAGQIRLYAAFGEATSGPVKFNYMAA